MERRFFLKMNVITNCAGSTEEKNVNQFLYLDLLVFAESFLSAGMFLFLTVHRMRRELQFNAEANLLSLYHNVQNCSMANKFQEFEVCFFNFSKAWGHEETKSIVLWTRWDVMEQQRQLHSYNGNLPPNLSPI